MTIPDLSKSTALNSPGTVGANSYLVITALGQDNPKVINQLTNTLANFGGNILNTRMTSLGGEFGIMLLIEGSWNAIAKIEANLPNIEKKYGLVINIRRTSLQAQTLKAMTYSVHAVTIDREGIINDLAKFFMAQDISIVDVSAHTFATNNGTRMSSMTMNISIGAHVHVPTLREKFMLYCDAINLDAGLDPLRD